MVDSKLEQVQSVSVAFGNVADGVYRVECELNEGEPALVLDSVMLLQAEDKQPPTVVQFLPGNGRHFADQVELSLTVSEPLDTAKLTQQSLLLWEDSLKTLPFTTSWQDCFRLIFHTQDLAPGHQYRLEVTEFDLVDRAGNQLGDSLQTFAFSTHDADSLGSISGGVTVSLAGEEQTTAVLKFKKAGSKTEQLITVPSSGVSGLPGETAVPRPFNLTVPPGKYLVTGFLDSNGDGRLTPGSVNPYRLGESRLIRPDTITVRARFETADVRILFD